jgi:transcriptional regulator with XRE-family HTH domain
VSSKSEHRRPGHILGARVRETRKLRDWSQGELARRVEELGYPMSRVTITKIEKGGERADRAPLQEVLVLAAALGVAPVHLIVPLEDDAAVEIAPKLRLSARQTRGWIRGAELLAGSDPAWEYYLDELPEDELVAVLEAVLGGKPTALTRGFSKDERSAIASELADRILPVWLKRYPKELGPTILEIYSARQLRQQKEGK